ncbi:uncharacterized protein LAJ45_01108 [Morchella importuna]|uniref:uncharacterized protein n=1 Tax=Morchella importuna TaxID=1174673 RepID=UPI001E8D85D1|nr:uncharacterized protein LAJ45_01108 [Morchella importuna]KAH8154580.1 hypothetical protein LAJ45_01108 [Morchella importuna]
MSQRRTRRVEAETSPPTILSPQSPRISSSSASPPSGVSSSTRETRAQSTRSTTTPAPRYPPGSRPSDSASGKPELKPLPPMLLPPYMLYNEGMLEPRLFVGPPRSLDLAIRQRVFQNATFEAHLDGWRATDTSLFRAATPGQLHGGGYRSLSRDPHLYSQGPVRHHDVNVVSPGGMPRDEARHPPAVTSYLCPQRGHVRSFPDARSPVRGTVASNMAYGPRGDLHLKKTQDIEDGAGTQTTITNENFPAAVSDRSTEENNERNSETESEINPAQEKTKLSSHLLIMTEKTGGNINPVNPFAIEASTSGPPASASAGLDDSVSPRTVTTTPHPPMLTKTKNSPPDLPPPQNDFQALIDLPRRGIPQGRLATVKREAGEDEGVGQQAGHGESVGEDEDEDEMEVC